MKAVILRAYGDADQLRYEDEVKPEPGDGEVLVRVRATSVNPVDWKIRSGAAAKRMGVELPAILGRDLAGEVEAVGRGVTGFAPGQRVMALANGTYAEYAVVKADALASIPDALSYEQAAALPLVVLTGAQLIERGVKAKAGQSVLVTGALGSVGRTACYVAGQHGAQVIAGVRAAQLKDAEALGTLGLEAVDEEEGLLRFKDLDAVADTVGGTTAGRVLQQLKEGGVFATVVEAPAHAGERGVHVETVYTRPDASRLYELADDVARKHFDIPIAKVFRLAEVREAHRFAEKGGAGGKIVLVV